MDCRQRQILREETPLVISSVSKDKLDRLITKLCDENILLDSHKELIEVQLGISAKCMKFIDILCKRGSYAYETFINVLKIEELNDVAEKLQVRSNNLGIKSHQLVVESDQLGNQDNKKAEEESYRTYKGYVVSIGDAPAEFEELITTFKDHQYDHHTNIVCIVEKIPIVFLFSTGNDTNELILQLFEDTSGLIFTTMDICVPGCYVFTAESMLDIIGKLQTFLSSQEGDFSTVRLIDRIQLRGTSSLDKHFSLKWKRD